MARNALATIKPGQPVPSGWNQDYRTDIAELKDIKSLLTQQAMLEGLVHSFKKLGLDSNELGRGTAWAELKIGELLGKPPGKGAGGPGRELTAVHSDLTHKQVSQFRKMAWPIKHRKEVTKTINGGKWRRNDRLRSLKRFENTEKVESASSIDELDGAFSTITVDPPWDWSDEGDVDQLGRAKPDYSTMTLDQLLEFPLGDKADTDCHLYCWVTNRSMPKIFYLIEEWGFRYITLLTWCKPSFGMGNYFRGSTEHIAFAVKGQLPLSRKDCGTWFKWPRPKGKGNSSKPIQFYDLVESCSPGPYLDVFSRYKHNDKWKTWGEDGEL